MLFATIPRFPVDVQPVAINRSMANDKITFFMATPFSHIVVSAGLTLGLTMGYGVCG